MVHQVNKGSAIITLLNDTDILITREFTAPKYLVYKAWTTPSLIKRWWHANRGEVTSAEIDLRVGGKWRWAMVTPSGFECAFHGEYRELIPNEKIVSTEVFEGAPEAPSLNTLTLLENGGCTTLTILVQHATREHRDAQINSGMEAGLQDALDLLDELAGAMA